MGILNFSGSRYGHSFTSALKRSFAAVWDFLPIHSANEDEVFRRRGVDSLVRMLLSDASGNPVDSKLTVLRRLLEGERTPEEVEQHIAAIRHQQPLSEEDTAKAIAAFPEAERRTLLRFLLSLAAAADTPDDAVDGMKRIFLLAGEEEEFFNNARGETLQTEERRRRIIGSGAGIAVALVVILVFIITATLLRSVIFGLILAYVLLPLEKFFERRQRRESGFFYWLFKALSMPAIPLQRLSQRIMRHSTESDPHDLEQRREKQIIARAVAQTALVVLVVIGGLLMLGSRVTVKYVNGFRTSAAIAAAASAEGVTPSAGEEDKFDLVISKIEERLTNFRAKVENAPIIRFLLDQTVKILRDENFRRELVTALLKRSGGVFSLTADVLGVIGTLVSDLLLTIFFALLFLMKLAEFCRDDDSRGRKSEYLVRTVFNGNWLPDTNDVIVSEARRIIGGITERLRIWVRGYLFLMAVDATVYTTVFFLLKVPYFPVLGIIAGCGILLPYIGPCLSASLTLLVTLAAGGSSGLQLAGIIAAYLIYNGIIEQFILYPAVIGESLGLTTLETIVVVLLGAVFAGLPGMLLAMPAASVLKYLIPKIHGYIRMRKVGEKP